MTRKWQKLSSRVAYQTPHMTVEEDEVIQPNGKLGIYSVVRSHPFCCIIALNKNNKLYIIKQFRYPINRNSWELPMGGSEGQNLLVAAKRELQEETGLIANTWQQIGKFETANGFSDQVGVVFVAKNLHDSSEHEQAEEGITDCKAFSYTKLKQMIRDGEILDGPTIAALYLSELHGYLK